MSTATRMYLTREEAAQAAGVSLSTIVRAINKGDLRAKRTGKDDEGNPTGKYLISVKAIEDWFDGLADA